MVAVETVYERLNWLRERAPNPRTGKAPMPKTTFSKLCGQSPPWFDALERRSKTDAGATIDAPTAEAVSKATGARVAWVLSGEGDPFRAAALATPAGASATASAPSAVATGGALATVPSAPSRWVETTPRYMNLEVAVKRAAAAGRPYPEDAVRAAGILMRRDYDPAPEEWAQLIELEAAVAGRFEKRERLVLEHEVAGPDPALLGRGRGKR